MGNDGVGDVIGNEPTDFFVTLSNTIISNQGLVVCGTVCWVLVINCDEVNRTLQLSGTKKLIRFLQLVVT